MVKKTLIVGCDFETDGTPEERYICQWSVWCEAYQKHGRTLKEFMYWLHTIIRDGVRYEGHRYKRYALFFHNLPYDSSYLREALTEYAETWKMDLTLIAPDNREIMIKLSPTPESKTMLCVNEVSIYDSARKIPAKLADVGALIGFEKLKEVSGNGFRTGWSAILDTLPEEEAFRYVDRDAEICGKAMLYMSKKGLDRPTIGSCALAQAKELLGKYDDEDKNYKKWFDCFPVLDFDTDKLIRKAFFGGVNYSEPGTYRDCVHIDRNSMYPSVMSFCDLPMGYPEVTSLEEADKSGCPYIVDGCFKLHLRPDGIPYFHFKNALDSEIEGLEPAAPVRDCEQWHSMSLTNVDIDTLSMEYEIETGEIDGVYIFRQHAAGFFKPYVDRYIKEKIRCGNEGDKVGRMIAKLLLNSLYGKLAQGYKSDVYTYEPDEEGIWQISAKHATREDYINMTPTQKAGAMKGYIPAAVFITSYARQSLITVGHAIKKNGGILVHADTDSWIFKGTPDMIPEECLDVGHTGKLGLWELEHEHIDTVYEGGYKRYVLETDGERSVTCAGVPPNMAIELIEDPIKIFGAVLGHETYQCADGTIRDTRKLLPRMIKGGKDLVPSTYDLDKPMGIYLRVGNAKI